MNLTEFAKEVHQNAVAHGWWDEERTFGEIVALCHSELSEALEGYLARPHYGGSRNERFHTIWDRWDFYSREAV